MQYYVELTTIREDVVRKFGRWDTRLNRMVVTKFGVDEARGRHMELWLEEEDPTNPGRTNKQSFADKETKYRNGRDFRKAVLGAYRLAMNRRFGWHAFNFWLEYGFMDAEAVAAINAARAGGANAPAGMQQPPTDPLGAYGGANEPADGAPADEKAARQAAARARRFTHNMANREVREAAARRGPGWCDVCAHWGPERISCLNCKKTLCLHCQGVSSEGVHYLMCQLCYQRTGGQLPTSEVVEPRMRPNICDFLAVVGGEFAPASAHHDKALVTCSECNRYR